jgi:hypothetical protein
LEYSEFSNNFENKEYGMTPEPSQAPEEEKITRKGWLLFSLLFFLMFFVLFLFILNSGEYGFALFIGIPCIMGYTTGFFVPDNGSYRLLKNIGLSILVIAAISGLLILLGAEGAICILMALGILVVPVYVGVVIGRATKSFSTNKKTYSVCLIVLLAPVLYLHDLYSSAHIDSSVSTSVSINASPSSVWTTINNRVNFGKSKYPLLNAGVSYPLSMEMQRVGTNCMLVCPTSNDTSRLLVTRLVPNRLLTFKHEGALLPMKELTLYNTFDMPHLHDYFKHEYGEFSLVVNTDGTTRLTATTKYTYDIAPGFYWKFWTEGLISQMHHQVLQKIKILSEQ